MYEDTIAMLRGCDVVHGNVPGPEAADRLAAVAVLHERILAEQAAGRPAVEARQPARNEGSFPP